MQHSSVAKACSHMLIYLVRLGFFLGHPKHPSTLFPKLAKHLPLDHTNLFQSKSHPRNGLYAPLHHFLSSCLHHAFLLCPFPDLASGPESWQAACTFPHTPCSQAAVLQPATITACAQTKQNTAQVLSPVHGMRCCVMLCCQWHIHSCLLALCQAWFLTHMPPQSTPS